MKKHKTTNGAGTWNLLANDDFPYDYYTTKTVTLEPNFGRPTASGQWGDGWWNSIGLHNPGIQFFCQEHLNCFDFPYVLSLWCADKEKPAVFKENMERMNLARWPDWVEINLSCPNVERPMNEAEQLHMVEAAAEVFGEVAVKVSPAMRAQHVLRLGGIADRLVMCNSLETEKGGLSGRPIKSLVMQLIHEVRYNLGAKTPITALGGIEGLDDTDTIEEYLVAGATDIAVGSHNLKEKRDG